MKKDYITPDIDLIHLSLSKDVLGDSKWEPTDNPIIDDPEEDPFG